MPPLEAIRLALQTIRVQKLKSFYTALGVCIDVMFLITVISVVDGMDRYMETQLVGKLIALDSFELRHRPNINIGDVGRETWMEYNRRPRIVESDVPAVVEALPDGPRWAMYAEGGVRKALGTTKGGILWRVLVEAVTLTATGAAIGLVLGWAGSFAIRAFTPVESSVPPPAVVAALATSAFTGIVFGMLPALRASRLDPVAALRPE